jgi:hypothetical protein
VLLKKRRRNFTLEAGPIHRGTTIHLKGKIRDWSKLRVARFEVSEILIFFHQQTNKLLQEQHCLTVVGWISSCHCSCRPGWELVAGCRLSAAPQMEEWDVPFFLQLMRGLVAMDHLNVQTNVFVAMIWLLAVGDGQQRRAVVTFSWVLALLLPLSRG